MTITFASSATTHRVARPANPLAKLLVTTPEVSIVLPAHNEQHNVQPLIEELHQSCSRLPNYEIIYVDDGSTDGTLAELSRLQSERFPDLRILSHAHSIGQSGALLSGVHAARGRLIVTLDADGQNPPAEIPAMVDIARVQVAGTHFCIAGYRHQRRDTRWKRYQSRLANAVRRTILQDKTPDTGCGLKVIPRDTWLQLPGFDHMHRFLPALIQRIGGSITIHPVAHRPRLHDQSKYGMLDRLGAGIMDIVGVLWLRHRTRATQVTELTAGH
jgi:glycosyltransferase involved in cell wall biosynthesis